MDVLLPAVYSAISGDSALGDLTYRINQFRHPENPKDLRNRLPVVVFRPKGGLDENGLHGAATNPEVEFSIWGYGASSYPDCVKAAQRVSEIFLEGISLSSGAALRWGEILNWDQIDQPDPETVLLRAVFRTRYWSAGRAEAVA